MKRIQQYPAEIYSVPALADYIDGGHEKRKEDAMWHISYATDEDKGRIESVMRKTSCKKTLLTKSAADFG